MSYKTILCYLRDDEGAGSVIRDAVAVATDHGAHLVGLHVIEPLAVPIDPLAAIPAEIYERYDADAQKQAERARDMFLEAARREGVVAEWRLERGFPRDIVQAQAIYADLIVIGRTAGGRSNSVMDELTADLAMTAGRPVLCLPGGPDPRRIGRKVMVAWNGSREAARAVTDALPVLQKADHVWIVSARQSGVPAMDIAAVLARHGVSATTQVIDAAADTRVGEMLLREADRKQCDLLVMGVFGHSRMNEWVFGGVSRYVLGHAGIPLLLAH